ncbi:hypothetical protein F53441_9574 [Fusarium austroafricanum]|uniref:Uncharacterized protein n=1 Tax=Fusarium austroafricanum TaxID=2364996 RepID=A0A8H4NW85_9HYPO|nr:hypothetical protein F53441_9574 [Fusarium austroafricanum]
MAQVMDDDGKPFEIDIYADKNADSEPHEIGIYDPMNIGSEPFQQQNYDPMDVDSEFDLMRCRDNAFSNTKQIGSQNVKARTSAKTTFEHNAFNRPSRGNEKLKNARTRRNGVNKLSRRKPKNQPERQAYALPEKDVENAENCEKTIPDWISLLRKTRLPNFTNSSDSCIINAFKAVDGVICGKQGTYLLRRLAYVQLMRLFVSLEAVIKSERESGGMIRKPGYGDASVAIDIYMSAQESHQHPNDLRRELKERKRAGVSWRYLSGPSPLFTMIYSQASELIMYA